MNKQNLQQWIKNEIIHILLKVNEGTILPVVADAQIKLLEKLLDEFNMTEIPMEEEYTT